MAKRKGKTIPVTINLTPKQIREAFRQLVEAEETKDWLEEPEVLEMLAKREKKVAEEIKKGQFIILEEFQAKLSKQ